MLIVGPTTLPAVDIRKPDSADVLPATRIQVTSQPEPSKARAGVRCWTLSGASGVIGESSSAPAVVTRVPWSLKGKKADGPCHTARKLPPPKLAAGECWWPDWVERASPAGSTTPPVAPQPSRVDVGVRAPGVGPHDETARGRLLVAGGDAHGQHPADRNP
jgi:hypothetical protein